MLSVGSNDAGYGRKLGCLVQLPLLLVLWRLECLPISTRWVEE
jgi:hypothetical protein